ncbi:hypothetical protein [Thermosynechococcus sp. FA-CM-4201]
MNLLQELLQTVEIGTPQTFGGMTLFPLLRPIAAEPDYWTLTTMGFSPPQAATVLT